METLLTAHPAAMVAIGSFVLAGMLAIGGALFRALVSAERKALTLERQQLVAAIEELRKAVDGLTSAVKEAALQIAQHEHRLTLLEVEHRERSGRCRES